MIERRETRHHLNGSERSHIEATFRTRAVRAGDDLTMNARPLAQPIHQGAVYAFSDGDAADAWFGAGEPVYARDGLPNVRSLERAIAGLEGAEDAHAVSSGMAAISLTLLSLLSAGDHLVTAAGCYRDTDALIQEHLGRFGIEASFVDLGDPSALRASITPRTKLIYAETISNPGMELADLPHLAQVAHAAGALLCVDNTLATPSLCRPIEHGADLVVHSVGKFLGGHHDLTAGAVAGSRRLIEHIRRGCYLLGPTLSPFDAWLALRGLKTLAPRIAWASATAAGISHFLATHPAIARVRYPGLADAQQSTLTRRLLPDGAGAVLAFDVVGGPEAAAAMIRGLRLIPYAPSLGGPTTIVSHPPQRESFDEDGMPMGRSHQSDTIRLSAGLEAASDLIADLRQALDQLPAANGFGRTQTREV